MTTQAGKAHVYFIVGGGCTKVGFSQNVERRLRSLRAGSPRPLELVYCTPGAHVLERELHDRLSDRHDHDEWFEGEVTEAEAIELVAQCTLLGSATSLTARNVLKSKVWSDCEEIQDRNTSVADARRAWDSAMADIDDFDKVATTKSHHSLAASLRKQVEAAGDIRVQRLGEHTERGGIEPVPPPDR